MGTRALPDMYALGLWAYISGKALMPMLQLLHKVTNYEKECICGKFLSTIKYRDAIVHQA